MEKLENKYLIFSYGTLKRGFPNYYVMEEIDAIFIDEAHTQYRYPLFVGGQWQVPFLLDKKEFHGSHTVSGEIFEVDDHGLKVLDDFEGVGTGYYKRQLVEVRLKTNQATKKVWCYFGGAGAEILLAHSEQLLSVYSTKEVDQYTPVWDR